MEIEMSRKCDIVKTEFIYSRPGCLSSLILFLVRITVAFRDSLRAIPSPSVERRKNIFLSPLARKKKKKFQNSINSNVKILPESPTKLSKGSYVVFKARIN